MSDQIKFIHACSGRSSDYKMVENSYFNYGEGRFQALGELNIRAGWFGVPGRMVMDKDYGGGVMKQRSFDDFPGVYVGMRE